MCDEKTIVTFLPMFFLLKTNGGKQMNQLEPYYVVRRTKDKDEQFAMIDALSLDEADAIFKVRYKGYEESMKAGDAYYVFQANELPVFDESHRIIFPRGEVIIHKKLA